MPNTSPGFARRVRRALKRLTGSGRQDTGSGPANQYPEGFHVVPRPRDLVGPWPDPPTIDGPARPVGSGSDFVESPQRFDLALFETLNAEYESHPVAATAPHYDIESVANRSRGRLLAIHRRIDLQGKTVLEIGCGSGVEIWHLAHAFGSDAWGIDMKPRMAWPFLAGEHVHLIEGDISTADDLPGGSFDRVISNTVWEHIEHPQAAIAQMHRVMKPGGLAWIRANLYRGPTASHRAREISFPFPHLLFSDAVIAEAMERAGRVPGGAAWVNRLTWEQYESSFREVGFRIRSLKFDLYPIDEPFYVRFEEILGRYPRRDLERGFFTVILEKPRR